MRFIGNKQNLVARIFHELNIRNITGESFFDLFAGSCSVGSFFKKNNYHVVSSDLLYFSYCLQQAYIVNNVIPVFAKLLPQIKCNSKIGMPLDQIISFLNGLGGVQGFIYHNYTPAGTIARMYFSEENGQKIDAIRLQIENWQCCGYLNENEYYILLACLIESVSFYANVSGVYAAFNKKWDPRAVKPLTLKAINILTSNQNHQAFYSDSLNLLDKIKTDILYLDPPYNQRQYAPNYHILETIALYDSPVIHGITGMRDYRHQRSGFCNKDTALEQLDKIARLADYKYLILSYNSEGIMDHQDICRVLLQYGGLEYVNFEYLRFKSNSLIAGHKKHIQEQLFILRKSC